MKVKTTHYRYITANGPSGPLRLLMPTWLLRQMGFGRFIEARGGFTRVDVELLNGMRSGAWARCSPSDNYVKADGRMIALSRALDIAQGAVSPEGHPSFILGVQALTDSIRCSPEYEWGRGIEAEYVEDREAGIAGLSIPIGGR